MFSGVPLPEFVKQGSRSAYQHGSAAAAAAAAAVNGRSCVRVYCNGNVGNDTPSHFIFCKYCSISILSTRYDLRGTIQHGYIYTIFNKIDNKNE
jgi:hypothetical protein